MASLTAIQSSLKANNFQIHASSPFNSSLNLKSPLPIPLNSKLLTKRFENAIKSPIRCISKTLESESRVEKKGELLRLSIKTLLLSLVATLSLHSLSPIPALADEDLTDSDKIRGEYLGIIKSLKSREPIGEVESEAFIEAAPAVFDEPAETVPTVTVETIIEEPIEIQPVVVESVVVESLVDEPELVNATIESDISTPEETSKGSNLSTFLFAGLFVSPILAFVALSNPEKL